MNLLILTSASVVHSHNTEIVSQESRANKVELNLTLTLFRMETCGGIIKNNRLEVDHTIL